MRKLENVVDWEKVYKQNEGYDWLDTIHAGQIGSLIYYPVPEEERKKWQEKEKQ